MPATGPNPLMIPQADVWALLDVIPDALIMLDGEWRCRYANAALETFLGCSPASVLGRHVSDVLEMPVVMDFIGRLQRAAAEQRSDVVAWTGPDGRAVTVHVRPRAGWTTLLLRRDVGAPATPPALEARLESRLLHAQKLEVIGRVASGIAHDFNNLLTVIKTYCEFVTAELPAGSSARADMDEVVQAANSAADLTRQLLSFSCSRVPQPQRLDVKVTITRVVGMLRRVLGEDIRIETDFAPSACVVLADPGQLEQVLMNLAVNARDAMPNGGALRLRIEAVVIDATGARTGAALRPGAYVSIVVEDTGVGIRPEVVGRIFEAFYTTKGEGTGLGLAMVLSIVERMGGDVSVESAPGRGSRFTVRLPCHDERGDDTASHATTRAEEAPPPPGRGETILLIEDDPGVRAAVRRILERLGYTVRQAATGAEALGIASTLAKAPHLVLTDMILPGESGQSVAGRLLQRWPAMPVLFMSGYTDDEIRRRGIMVPGGVCLEKPIALELLGHAVRRSLDGPSGVAP
jgi:two-component system cell cycle sensor histidine kinase/response regulator CckA